MNSFSELYEKKNDKKFCSGMMSSLILNFVVLMVIGYLNNKQIPVEISFVIFFSCLFVGFWFSYTFQHNK